MAESLSQLFPSAAHDLLCTGTECEQTSNQSVLPITLYNIYKITTSVASQYEKRYHDASATGTDQIFQKEKLYKRHKNPNNIVLHSCNNCPCDYTTKNKFPTK